MARTSTYSVAVGLAVAIVAALAFGSLFAGSVAHADTWSSSSTQSWGHSNNNHNNNWNNNNWNNNNWNNHNSGWNNNNWNNHNSGWNNNNHFSSSNWWRWHRVGSRWQQYFDWTLYCQWAYQNYGYVSAQCAPYVYSGYNTMGY